MAFGLLRGTFSRLRGRPPIPPNARIQRIRIVRKQIRHPFLTILTATVAGLWLAEQVVVSLAMRRKDQKLDIPIWFPKAIPPKPYTVKELGMTAIVDHTRHDIMVKFDNEKEWIDFIERALCREFRRRSDYEKLWGPPMKVKAAYITFSPLHPKPSYEQLVLSFQVSTNEDPSKNATYRSLIVALEVQSRNHMQVERNSRLFTFANISNLYKRFLLPTYHDLTNIILTGPSASKPPLPRHPSDPPLQPPSDRITAIVTTIRHNYAHYRHKIHHSRLASANSFIRDMRGEVTFKGLLIIEGRERDAWVEVDGQLNPKRKDLRPCHFRYSIKKMLFRTDSRLLPQMGNRTLTYGDNFVSAGREKPVTQIKVAPAADKETQKVDEQQKVGDKENLGEKVEENVEEKDKQPIPLQESLKSQEIPEKPVRSQPPPEKTKKITEINDRVKKLEMELEEEIRKRSASASTTSDTPMNEPAPPSSSQQQQPTTTETKANQEQSESESPVANEPPANTRTGPRSGTGSAEPS